MKKFIFGLLCVGLVALFTPVSFASDGPTTTKDCVFDDIDNNVVEGIVVADATIKSVESVSSDSYAVEYNATKSNPITLPAVILTASVEKNRYDTEKLKPDYNQYTKSVRNRTRMNC